MTERDLMRRLIAGGLNPDTTTVSEIMTPDVRVAKEDDSLVDWLRIMSNERFRRLPIVDENNRLTSIMTQGDFVSYTWPDLIGQAVTLAKGTMNKNYQIFYIFGGVLAYTVLMVAILGIFT
jgi:CBS-domain-containing membrane protein